MQSIIISAFLGYAIGSVPFSYIIARKATGKDLRSIGSGNIGATNVIRAAGAKIGIFAFLSDFVKGIVAYLLALALFDYHSALVASAFAVLGHCYSIFMKFKGGKGVATSFGSILITNPLNALIILGVHALTLTTTKYMSLASVLAAATLPILAFAFGMETYYKVYAIFIGLFVIYRHKENIARLISKKEPKFSFKKSAK